MKKDIKQESIQDSKIKLIMIKIMYPNQEYFHWLESLNDKQLLKVIKVLYTTHSYDELYQYFVKQLLKSVM